MYNQQVFLKFGNLCTYMIKVGILTFHRAHNYGAVLQAYALLTCLQKMGCHAELIDYWPLYRKGHYDLFGAQNKPSLRKAGPLAFTKQMMGQTLSLGVRWKKYAKFNAFIKHKLQVSGVAYPDGHQTPDKYNLIICGSDQIWRYNFRGNRGFDDVYFAQYPVHTKVPMS